MLAESRIVRHERHVHYADVAKKCPCRMDRDELDELTKSIVSIVSGDISVSVGVDVYACVIREWVVYSSSLCDCLMTPRPARQHFVQPQTRTAP